MGCCESTPQVPDEIMEDPRPGEATTFVTKSCSMFNADFEVFKESEDDANRWLFLNKIGKASSGDTQVLLENYVRGGNPDVPKQGQVLWTVKYEEHPDYSQDYGSDSDSDDGIDFGDFMDFMSGRFAMKWRMKTKAKFIPGTKGDQEYKIRCKAKGTATREVRHRRDADGNDDTSYDDHTYVKKISCKVYDSNDMQLDKFTVYRDKYDSNSGSIEFDNMAFNVQKNCGWGKKGLTVVRTKPGAEPSMSLLMAHLCMEEFTPNEIAGDFSPNWDSVRGYNGWNMGLAMGSAIGSVLG